jgi:hypothetical protein
MSKRVGELCLDRKKKLKRPSSADAIDTPPGKLRNTTGTNGTTRKDTQRVRGFHNLVIDTEDTTKLASSLSYARKEDSLHPSTIKKAHFRPYFQFSPKLISTTKARITCEQKPLQTMQEDRPR